MFRLASRVLATLALALAPLFTAASEPASPMRVALIFDDGPVPDKMPAYLELFAREGIRVSFAHVGREVAAHPEFTRRAAEAGHEIINHSYTHPHCKQLEDAAITGEIRDTQAAVLAAIGREPHWYWAPYGEWDDRIAAAVRTGGLEHFPMQHFRLVSSDDWNTATDAAAIRRNATTGVQDHTVILFHEWRAETLEQLPAILADLRAQGCTFHTFSELAATRSAAP